jgi:sporulation protein YlmC with PRC-barrel domain
MSAAPTENWTISNYYKQSVYDPKESKIGDIDDVLIDKAGKVTGLVIGVGGFWARRKRRHCAIQRREDHKEERQVVAYASGNKGRPEEGGRLYLRQSDYNVGARKEVNVETSRSS